MSTNNENKSMVGMNADEAMTELKIRKHKITDQELQAFYDSGLALLEKFNATHQVAAGKKLIFHLDCCEKERQLVKAGIDTFIYADDVKLYMDKVATDDVRLIELDLYEREIPDEVVQVIQQVKPMFTSLWVLYTDYAHSKKQVVQQRKTVEHARISRDPILFGVMMDEENQTMNERYYFLADWVDQYCDLTLEKFLDQMREKGHTDVAHHISTPTDLNTLRAQFDSLKMVHGEYKMVADPQKKLLEQPKNRSFFQKIRTFLTGGDRE